MKTEKVLIGLIAVLAVSIAALFAKKYVSKKSAVKIATEPVVEKVQEQAAPLLTEAKTCTNSAAPFDAKELFTSTEVGKDLAHIREYNVLGIELARIREYVSGSPVYMVAWGKRGVCFKTGGEIPIRNVFYKFTGDLSNLGKAIYIYAAKAEIKKVYELDTAKVINSDPELLKQIAEDKTGALKEFVERFRIEQLADARTRAQRGGNADFGESIYGIVAQLKGGDVPPYRREAPKVLGAMSTKRKLQGSLIQRHKGEVEAWLQENNGVIVDVRPPADFQKDHLPGSINIPYAIAKPIDFSSMNNFLANMENDSFDLSKLPPDKNKSIAFTGERFEDQAAFRAFIAAFRAGYVNAIIGHDGVSGINGHPRFVNFQDPHQKKPNPPDPRVPSAISAIELVQILAKNPGSIIVDVRSFEEFSVRSILGARNLPFSFDVDRVVEDHELKNIKVPLENIAPMKTTPLIIVGADSSDWRAEHATRWAKLNGWTEARWFLGGLGEWLGQADFAPDTFKTVTGTSDRKFALEAGR